mmetsp:Transcript_9422/g.19490  ORF Transcript_9422/g.19490 Transcript_9422/m.19490 type:complete len:405 (-) Transcript_9422:310-1524(-)|eukprot:CAMPEP_0118929210 /NCGR_PEP_ID=MMETSP1169-20130426/6268_1 /TAXON_ID=36882 /ORGANISM="Pyramimonas obovata, Strain CCMP722" /LENGTH=404 /DNA_ID=CAMNT_0006871351 /DNA_START=220 /DNA_END=1434 /DNA_ORIENTATION=+
MADNKAYDLYQGDLNAELSEDDGKWVEAAKARAENIDLANNEELPSLFWDSKIDDPENPDVLAMEALMDELTAEERADNYKNRGNDCMKMPKNKYYVRNAVTFYTRALAEECGNKILESACLSNRAQAHILLGNNRKAFDDSWEAIQRNSDNIKAYFRGAKSGIEIKLFSEAASLCQAGLKCDPTNKDLQKLEEKAKAGIKKQWEEAKKLKQVKREAQMMFDALKQRGVQMGTDIYGSEGVKPVVDEEGNVLWQVIFLYPETMQSDVIQAASEESTLDDHLHAMFDPEVAPPLEWDSRREYTRDRLELYYQESAAPVLSDTALMQFLLRGTAADEGTSEVEGAQNWGSIKPRWVKVDTSKTLLEIIAQEGHVLPAHPIFHVVSIGTEFHKLFLSGMWDPKRAVQ